MFADGLSPWGAYHLVGNMVTLTSIAVLMQVTGISTHGGGL